MAQREAEDVYRNGWEAGHAAAMMSCTCADEYDALRARGADVSGDVPRTAEAIPDFKTRATSLLSEFACRDGGPIRVSHVAELTSMLRKAFEEGAQRREAEAHAAEIRSSTPSVGADKEKKETP